MTCNREIIDLTASDDELECEDRSEKRRENCPHKSDLLPVLERPIPIPDFRMAELAEAYMADPPILEPEVKPAVVHPENSSPENQSSSTLLLATSARNVGEPEIVQRVPENAALLTYANIGMKRIQRSARADGGSTTQARQQELKQKLSNTITKMKDQENRGNPKEHIVQKRVSNSNPGTNVPTKRQRKNHAKLPPATEKILEANFAKSCKPTVSQFHEISSESGLTIQEVKKWFNNRNKMGNIPPANSSSSRGILDRLPLGSADSRSQVQRNNSCEDYQQAGPSGVQYKTSFPKENFAGPSCNESGTSKVKYIRAGMRIDDVEAIKSDIKKVKECNSEKFRSILVDQWNLKADRIFNILTRKSTETKAIKETIYKEARRLKDLASRFSPLSEEQDKEIATWKNSFIVDKCKAGNDRTHVKHEVEEAIMPWIVPFVYARCTLQDERLLTLEVALNDFCKVSNNKADWEWQTPRFLQYDMY